MKEATGELNMTVITIVAIGALVAFFYLVIWPNIQVGMTLSSACNSAGTAAMNQTLDDGSTIVCNGADPNVCTYTPAGGGAATTRTCD
ncbi:MAG: hypothetical protein E7161_00280 [Firmicutes bacterium]|nr:hypothetical protein [Bacillota bacterium]